MAAGAAAAAAVSVAGEAAAAAVARSAAKREGTLRCMLQCCRPISWRCSRLCSDPRGIPMVHPGCNRPLRTAQPALRTPGRTRGARCRPSHHDTHSSG
eukprot:2122903-Prymnesium_polylepis.2